MFACINQKYNNHFERYGSNDVTASNQYVNSFSLMMRKISLVVLEPVLKYFYEEQRYKPTRYLTMWNTDCP